MNQIKLASKVQQQRRTSLTVSEPCMPTLLTHTTLIADKVILIPKLNQYGTVGTSVIIKETGFMVGIESIRFVHARFSEDHVLSGRILDLEYG
jgi:hypothetical protein